MTFDDWFEKQHGQRPGGLSDAELLVRIDKGNQAQCILGERKEWDARRESALYAWQAREKEP